MYIYVYKCICVYICIYMCALKIGSGLEVVHQCYTIMHCRRFIISVQKIIEVIDKGYKESTIKILYK